MTQTETGNEFSPLVGIGEKIHLNAYLCLHLDYRIMQYHEQINSKNPSTLGQPVGSRTNTSDAVLLGLDFSY